MIVQTIILGLIGLFTLWIIYLAITDPILRDKL